MLPLENFLPNTLRALLREINMKRQAGLNEATRIRNLGPLIDACVDEFCDTGLNSDDEPNERGHSIEELIDKLNAYRLASKQKNEF